MRQVGDYLNNPKARKGNMPEDLGPFVSCRFTRTGVITLPDAELVPRGLCVCRQHRNDGECPVLRDFLQEKATLKDPRWAHLMHSMGPEARAAIDAGDRDDSFVKRWAWGFHLQLSHRHAVIVALQRRAAEAAALEASKEAGAPGGSTEAATPGGKAEEAADSITFVYGHSGSTHGIYAMQATDLLGQRKRDPVYAAVQGQWGTEFSREAFRDAFAASVKRRENLRVQWGEPVAWDEQPYVVVTHDTSRYWNRKETRSVAVAAPAAP